MIVGVVGAAWMGWTRKPQIWLLYMMALLTPVTLVADYFRYTNRKAIGLRVETAEEYMITFALTFVIIGLLFFAIYWITRGLRRWLHK
jgi:hypothetical protein